MKTLFPGFYDLDELSLATLWKEACFVFDTNVLLTLYHYSEKSRRELLDALTVLAKQDRLWIPNQVALEYLRKRKAEIDKQAKVYATADKDLTELGRKIKAVVEQLEHQYRFLKFGDFVPTVKQAIDDAKRELNEQTKLRPRWEQHDSILDELESIFKDRIGAPYLRDQYELVLQEVQSRYARQAPPGFKDSYPGDAIIWFQMIDYAKITARSLIFVTGDLKGDLWLADGQLRPRPELIQEMYQEAHALFHMCQTEKFLSEAQARGVLHIEKADLEEVVEEIVEVREAELAAGRQAASHATHRQQERRADYYLAVDESGRVRPISPDQVKDIKHASWEDLVSSQRVSIPDDAFSISSVAAQMDALGGIRSVADELGLSGITEEFGALGTIRSLADEAGLSAITGEFGPLSAARSLADELGLSAITGEFEALSAARSLADEAGLSAIVEQFSSINSISQIVSPSVPDIAMSRNDFQRSDEEASTELHEKPDKLDEESDIR
jgi:predicted nucleic acid-binding protein